jgi:hypothetical protein|tara:strand:- start:5245 stop:6051 length:807 start_codon:yes stop_codon:yes gene_type:complete
MTDYLEQDIISNFIRFCNIYINYSINNIQYFLIILLKKLLLFSELCRESYINTKEGFILTNLNKSIYQIDYINLENNEITNIYNTNLLCWLFTILNNDINPYSISNKTTNIINDTVNLNNSGFLNISYYNEKEKKNSLINIKNFKRENNNYLFKSIDILTTYIISNFIVNNVTMTNKEISYVEIVTNNNKINITDLFRTYKDSFKENNMKLCDFISVLYNLINNEKLDIKNFENIELILTDCELNDRKYNVNDYINFKTLYQELSEKN